jgi:ferric-dicitrate binding protein FerR (iron transport regulator)
MKNDYLLHKFLNGEASEEEIAVLKRSEEYARYMALAEASKGFELPAFDREANYQEILANRTRRIGRSPGWLRYTTQIAAVAVILIAGILFIRNMDTRVETGIAQKQEFELPDGSLVRLNSASKMRYNKNDWKNDRSINMSGEAYFKVEKGQKFSVNTSNGTVSVLGTQFNVFVRDSILSVVCYEGLVAVEYQGRSEKLPGGKSIAITNGRWSPIAGVDITEPAWLHNESVFKDTSLASVLAELKNYYNLTINLQEEHLNQLRFTGSFPHNDLEVALRSICEPLKIQFEIANDQVKIYAP